MGFVRRDLQSSLVTSTPEISTSCPSILPQLRGVKSVNIHPIHRRGDCYTESICNLGGLAKSTGLIDSDLFSSAEPAVRILFKIMKSAEVSIFTCCLFCLVKNKNTWLIPLARQAVSPVSVWGGANPMAKYPRNPSQWLLL